MPEIDMNQRDSEQGSFTLIFVMPDSRHTVCFHGPIAVVLRRMPHQLIYRKLEIVAELYQLSQLRRRVAQLPF